MDREDESIYLLDMSRCQPREAIDSDFAPGGEFQKQHPEYRCVTPEGNRTRHLSHAFPAVRDQYVELFREWVDDYEADGACISSSAVPGRTCSMKNPCWSHSSLNTASTWATSRPSTTASSPTAPPS